MQYPNNRFEPLEQFGIAFPEFVKCFGLFLEHVKDSIGAIAAIDLGGEWMIAEISLILLGVLRQSGIEKSLKIRGSRDWTRSRGHGIMGEMSDV